MSSPRPSILFFSSHLPPLTTSPFSEWCSYVKLWSTDCSDALNSMNTKRHLRIQNPAWYVNLNCFSTMNSSFSKNNLLLLSKYRWFENRLIYSKDSKEVWGMSTWPNEAQCISSSLLWGSEIQKPSAPLLPMCLDCFDAQLCPSCTISDSTPKLASLSGYLTELHKLVWEQRFFSRHSQNQVQVFPSKLEAHKETAVCHLARSRRLGNQSETPPRRAIESLLGYLIHVWTHGCEQFIIS